MLSNVCTLHHNFRLRHDIIWPQLRGCLGNTGRENAQTIYKWRAKFVNFEEYLSVDYQYVCRIFSSTDVAEIYNALFTQSDMQPTTCLFNTSQLTQCKPSTRYCISGRPLLFVYRCTGSCSKCVRYHLYSSGGFLRLDIINSAYVMDRYPLSLYKRHCKIDT